jgi:hypothetical protein
MISPTITDWDEWNYLDTLKDSSRVGYPHSADQGYYAQVLRYKYPQCHAQITAMTFQILQPGFSSGHVPLTEKQMARQQLLDTFETPKSAQAVTKNKWLRALEMNGLLPKRS